MLKESEVKKIEKIINYTFNNKALLHQAFTRRSYSVIHGGCDNEVLEFYGDRILDMAVVMDFYDKYGHISSKHELKSKLDVGELAKRDIQLIKNSNLAQCISFLGLTKFIQVGLSKEKVVMKNKADLFEAILGAVAIDSSWNLNVIQQVYRTMMTSRLLYVENDLSNDYIEQLNTLIWKYELCKTENKYEPTTEGVKCSFVIFIDGQTYQFSGYGETSHLAKMAASEPACKFISLFLEGNIFNAGDFPYDQQLKFLEEYGVISNLDYKYEFFPANREYPEDLWRCYVTCNGLESEYSAEATTMECVRDRVSYELLHAVLGIKNDISETEDESVEEVHGQGLLKLILSKYATSIAA